MPVLCRSRKVTWLQVLLLASLTAAIDAGSCALPAKLPGGSALLQRHTRRGSQPVPEFEKRELLFARAADNDHDSNNLSQSALPSRTFVGTLVEPEEWLALDNSTAGRLATATDVGLGAAIVGEPANSAQNFEWQKVTSAAQIKQPVSTGFKTAHQPWGRVADDDVPASDNVTAIDVTTSATDSQHVELSSPTVDNNAAPAALTPGSDVNNSHLADITVDNATANVPVSLAVGSNSDLAAGMAASNASLNDNVTAMARPALQNSLVVATKDVFLKGHKDSKDADADKDEDATAKGKKSKIDDKESPGAKPAQVNAVVAYVARMTALDFVGFGGAGVVMFLFLVLADII